MRHLTERLPQEQAVFGNHEADATPLLLLHDPAVIEFRRVTSQREAKAVLTRPLAVTCSLIAAVPSQNRLDVVDE